MGKRGIEKKCVAVCELQPVVRETQSAGKVVVFTNGCFDLLHPGHVRLLQDAKQFGDILVVGLNSDDSVRRLKGPGRPIFPEDDRVLMLAALACVDYVVVFEEDTPIPLLERLRPDILVKGDEYRPDQVVGRELVEGYGGRVERVPIVAGLSTTDIVERILCNHVSPAEQDDL